MSISFQEGIQSLSGVVGLVECPIGQNVGGVITPYINSSNVFPIGNTWYKTINTDKVNNIITSTSISMTRSMNTFTGTNKDIFKIPLYHNDAIAGYLRVWAEWNNNMYYWVLKFTLYRNSDYTGELASTTVIQTGAQPSRHANFTLVGVQNAETGTTDAIAIYFECNSPNPYFTQFNNTYCKAVCINRDYIKSQWGFDFSIQTTSEEVGGISTEGGYTGGTFDDSSDTIAIPSAPVLGVTKAGFINVYAPTAGELNQFGSELFPDLSFTPVSQGGTPSSVTDALVAMAQVLVDFGNQIPALIDMYINANLINYVIDCHILPVAPTTDGNSPLKVGFKTFSQNPLKVSSDYVDFDCGSLNVGEYYANFADYSPYTSAKLYLPFVGFMDIAPEYWQSGTLSVTYRFNVIDGSFVAYVKSTSSKSKLSDTVIAQFGGNACVHIPITGLNYASMVSGIVSAVSPLLPSSKSGAGTADTLVNSANTIASAKPTMQQSNGYNATTSFLTVRVPYLLIERSVSNFSRNFAEENGIPSNITMSFAGLTGFTKATMLHLDGIAGATDDDLNEIAQLLSEGVIL